MLNRKNIILLILTAVSVGMAIFAVLWSRSVEQQLQNPELFTDTTLSSDEDEYLVSDFADLLSGEDMETLYQGQEGNFITT